MRLAARLIGASALVLLIAGIQLQAGSAALAGEPTAKLTGTWKLIVLAFGDDEFAIISINDKDGKPAASVVVSQKMVLADASVERVATQGHALEIVLRGAAGLNRFRGTLVVEGSQAGKILGSFLFRGVIYPARLERTESQRLADLKPSAIIQDYSNVARERDPKKKMQSLRDLTKKHQGNPTNYLFYGELLAAAEAGGLDAAEVNASLEAWLEDARPYGPVWVGEVRRRALKALSTARPYASLTLELAMQADREIDEDQSLEQKAAVVALLARAATLAGKPDIARAAQTRSAGLESRLDQEYRKEVPPFKLEKFAGRKDPKADRVVLLELFTGAQCPPCVAADVAFDALLETYQPTELIGLQYHLHIPGPDPLTCDDALGRQQYFGDEIAGTPTVFFNGHSEGGGGGPMQLSEQKYKQYRGLIDPQLETASEATIHLSATRTGDEIKIAAQATVTGKPIAKQNEPAQATDGRRAAEHTNPARHRLRLVLTEESIRYIGSNKLRFHHHVVRGFPGGLEGKDLSSGSGEITITINLADRQRDIEKYLSDFGQQHPFPGTLPEIALKDLSIVAFVQNDTDKSVLHAVMVPVR